MNLSQVSRTAISTLVCRAVEAGREGGVYHDPMAVLCLDRMAALASADEKKWILRQKRLYSGYQAHHARALVRRVGIFDNLANQFISDHPGGTVVNLGSGFDTRFWRIKNEGCRFIEVDLPEVAALKRELLEDRLGYELIGCSVLDPAWIDRVTSQGSSAFLLLAEGLFMYLPRPGAVALFQRLAQRFERSRLVLDTIPVQYTRGLLKMLIALETRYTWGLETTYVFGINDPREIESYAPGLRIRGVQKGSMFIGQVVTIGINEA